MQTRKIKTKKLTRAMPIESGSIDEENRTVDVSFSSESEVKRWFGREILDHKAGSVDLSRLKNGAAVLIDHYSDQVGVVETAEIKDKRGYARLRFSKSQRGKEVFQDIVDGIRQNISVGYSIQNMREEKNDKDKLSIYRAMKWTPGEISVVGVPADHSIGIGRAASMDEEYDTEITDLGRSIENNNKPTENEKMENDKQKIGVEVIKNEASERALRTERSRVKEIQAIVKGHPATSELARSAINEGMPLDEFQRKAFEAIAGANAKPVDVSPVQLSAKEEKRYSVLNVIRALADNNPGRAGFENEVSQEIAKTMRKDPQGMYIPWNLGGGGQRAMEAGTDSAGGYLVDTTLKTDSFIQMLEKKLVLKQAGAKILSGLVGDIAIPKQTGGASVYWVGEDGDVGESTPEIGQIGLTPKTMGTYTDITRKLLKQSSMDMEAFVRMDLARAAAHGFEMAGLKGTGVDNQPLGLFNIPGIGVVDLGTDGEELTWEDVVAMETIIAASDGDVDGMSYITNAKIRGKLKTTLKAEGTANFIWEAGNSVNGYPCRITNHVQSDLTKGTGEDLSAMYFGNFFDMIIGMWGGLDLLVNPYTFQTSGKIRVSILQDMDVVIRNNESFSICKDIVTI